jgi:prephenate dehydratase
MAVPALTFPEVFGLVERGEVDYGVLPVENSGSGTVPETYQLLLEQSYEAKGDEVRVQIVDEIVLPINHSLFSASQIPITEIKTLYSHAQPRLQCARFIEDRLRSVEIVETTSTAEAARRLAADPSGACIGSPWLGDERGLATIASKIQDLNRNLTRFVSISSKHVASRGQKTTAAFVIPNVPGKLLEALALVADQKINLTSIKTLPVRDTNLFREAFHDWFVVDLETSTKSDAYRRFATDRRHRELFIGFKVLGCYLTSDPEGTAAGRDDQSGATDLAALIRGGESATVEFKASLRYDRAEHKPNKDLATAVARTIAGFMNADGGTLFIGIGDDREPIGIEDDILILTKKTVDGFLLALTQVVVDHIGIELATLVDNVILEYEGRQVCAVTVKRSTMPAFIRSGHERHFCVRIGNSTRQLPVDEAMTYQSRRFFKDG